MLDSDATLMTQALVLAACGMGLVFVLLGLLVGCISLLLPRFASLPATAAEQATDGQQSSADQTARRAARAAAIHHHRRQQHQTGR